MENRCSWAIAVLLLVGSMVMASEASIHHYRNRTFTLELNARFFQGGSEGLYASSFIRFDDVSFVRTLESAGRQNPMQSATGLVEAIVVEGNDRERIGGSFPRRFCCTPELADAGLCNLGEVIISRDPPYDPELPKRIQTFFQGNKTEAKMSPEALVINKTGVYYLYFMVCDPDLDGTIVSGRTVWKNPYGFLPGKVAPLRNFFGFMSLAYLLLGLVWFLRFARFWKKNLSISQLQFHISLLVALGICEMALQYVEYATFNSTGIRPMGVTSWSMTVSSTRKILSRFLLLVVSMSTLGGITARVSVLGVVYFLATVPLQLFEHLGNINDSPGKAIISWMIPVVLLDVFFILWIFSSLARTVETLQIRRNLAKLKLYRKLSNAFSIYVLLSIGWISFEAYFYSSDAMGQLRMAWIIPAVWNLLSYALLASTCIIWPISADHGESGQSTTEYDEIQLSTITLDGAR